MELGSDKDVAAAFESIRMSTRRAHSTTVRALKLCRAMMMKEGEGGGIGLRECCIASWLDIMCGAACLGNIDYVRSGVEMEKKEHTTTSSSTTSTTSHLVMPHALARHLVIVLLYGSVYKSTEGCERTTRHILYNLGISMNEINQYNIEKFWWRGNLKAKHVPGALTGKHGTLLLLFF